MGFASEWKFTLPVEGAWLQVWVKIPDMAAVNADDAAFIDGLREKLMDRIHEIIKAKQGAGHGTGGPTENA